MTAIDRVDAWYAGDTAFHTMQRVDVTLPGTDPAAWADGPIDGAPQNSLVDADADTYFFSPNPSQAAQSLDCDDANAGIHPGATEILDLVDQDCDHQVDEGLTLEPYAGTRYFTDAIDATGPTETVGPTDAALQALLDGATTSIDAAIYDFSRANLRDALVNAHNRGVRVRVMGDDEAYQTPMYQPFYQSLAAAGIPVLYDMRGAGSLAHNKFAVIDGTTVWTGSLNWSNTAATYNAENAIAIVSPHLAQAYTTEFQEMFDPLTGCNGVCKRDNTTHSVRPGRDAGRVLLLAHRQRGAGHPGRTGRGDRVGLLRHVLPDQRPHRRRAGEQGRGRRDGARHLRRRGRHQRLFAGREALRGRAADQGRDVRRQGAPQVRRDRRPRRGPARDHRLLQLDLRRRGEQRREHADHPRRGHGAGVLPGVPAAVPGHPAGRRVQPALAPSRACRRASDGIDNDYDNLIDAADANCRESTPALCLDGLDNDGDGKVDTADLDCYRCRLAAMGISGGATVAAGQPLALTLQLDPAQGPLTYAWSDQGATTPGPRPTSGTRRASTR